MKFPRIKNKKQFILVLLGGWLFFFAALFVMRLVKSRPLRTMPSAVRRAAGGVGNLSAMTIFFFLATNAIIILAGTMSTKGRRNNQE
jgi:hypothetical protein